MLASGGAITNCIIEDNFCDGDGGGLYLLVSSPSIEGCIVRRNVCGSDGGGVFIQSASPHLTGCMIADNECDIRGGGIAVSGGSPVIEGCLVSGNTGAFGSGISSLQFSSPRILSTVIVENGPREGRKGLGGGIYAGTGAPQIESCTIVGNENDLGGGIFFYDSSGAELSRSIVAFNRRGSAMACAMTSPVVSCCDFFGNEDVDTICGMDQGGNFSLDPLLCADYSISDRSPCRAEASPPGCGLVGALDVGCAAAVEATTWGRIKARQGRR